MKSKKMMFKSSLVCFITGLMMVLSIGCAGVDQLRLQDAVSTQKLSNGEWRFPGPVLIANLEMTVRDSEGTLKDHRLYQNLVVTAGKAGVASRINGDGALAVFNYVAIGTGVTAPAAENTTLLTEITTGGGARAVATVSRVTTTVTNDTAKWVITYNFTAAFAITESGVFNAASVGTLLARKTFSAINVGIGDSLQVSWTVQAS